MADGCAPGYDVPASALARNRRGLGVKRSVTLSAKRSAKRDIDALRLQRNDLVIAEYERPRTRGDCLPGGCNESRPCPWVSCRAHLAVDVDPRNGSLKINFPDREAWELTETCAYDIADRGGLPLEETGAHMNLTRERVRQLEVRGLARAAQVHALTAHLDTPPRVIRAAPAEPKPQRGRPRATTSKRRTKGANVNRTPQYEAARAALRGGATVHEAAEAAGLSRATVSQLATHVRREVA